MIFCSSGETGIEEGCLSIPEQRALVPRAEKVKIRALDRDGKPFELEADGLLAIASTSPVLTSTSTALPDSALLKATALFSSRYSA